MQRLGFLLDLHQVCLLNLGCLGGWTKNRKQRGRLVSLAVHKLCRLKLYWSLMSPLILLIAKQFKIGKVKEAISLQFITLQGKKVCLFVSYFFICSPGHPKIKRETWCKSRSLPAPDIGLRPWGYEYPSFKSDKFESK